MVFIEKKTQFSHKQFYKYFCIDFYIGRYKQQTYLSGGGTLMMDQVIHIVTTATRQTRESPKEKKGTIECALN